MQIFAVMLNEPNPEVRKKISEVYPRPAHYALSDASFLVQTNESAADVAHDIGLKGKGEQKIQGALGVVFKANASYSGFNERALWDWLREAEGRG